MAVKRPRICHEQKREDETINVNSFKQTRLGEDQEEILYGLCILEGHDAADIVCHDATDIVGHDSTNIETKVKPSHLGHIWFPHSTHGLVRQLLRVSQLGSTWSSHPKHGLLRRSGRISASKVLV
jgi:hypothetical protein